MSIAMATNDPSQPFADMAARIGKIDPVEFAGAIVMVPPEGEALAFLITDPSPNIFQFLVSCETRIQERKADALQRAQDQNPWNRPR